MLIIGIVIGLLWFNDTQSSACTDIAAFKKLVEGEPRSLNEYRGRYVNLKYKYSVRIPKGLTAYDGRDEANHNGFGLALGTPPESFIFVSGDYNSSEYNTPGEAAREAVEFLRQQGNKIESETITKSHLGTLDAALLVVMYTCAGSPNRYIKSSMMALTPDKSFRYTLEIYSSAKRYESARVVLDKIIKSWRMAISRKQRRR
jgi:hypothetical protein